MYKVSFSIVFAWAFLWRLLILYSIAIVMQFQGLRWFIDLTTFSLVNFMWRSVMMAFLAFTPFVLTVYWMLVRGVMFKITQRYIAEREVTTRVIKQRKMVEEIKHWLNIKF